MTIKNRTTLVHTEPTRILHTLVGLKNIRVLEYRRMAARVELLIEQTDIDQICPSCQAPAFVKDRPIVRYIDLPAFGTNITIAWRKHRLYCPIPACPRRSWTVSDHRIAAKQALLTTRCAKWVTEQVGRGRAISDVARKLGCDWHTINDTVTVYGKALLAADTRRITSTTALGLDETSFVKRGGYRREYATTIADVGYHQILEILPTRDLTDVARWVHARPGSWKGKIEYGALDMSPTYAAVYTVTLPKAKQVIDAFHLVQLANRSLDEVRRRVQREHTGQRGRAKDPLFRARRILLAGEERPSQAAHDRLVSLLTLGDPGGEVAIAYRVKERVREFYQCGDKDLARNMLTELVEHCRRPSMPKELRRFGATIHRWSKKIRNYHHAKISNGPTEALNNLIKRVKRVGYGFRNFTNYRVRALLYTGRPNWRLLSSIVAH